MKNWLTIFFVIAISEIAGLANAQSRPEREQTTSGDGQASSVIVVSKKHKRTLKLTESINYEPLRFKAEKVEVQKPLPSYSPDIKPGEKVDTFIDNNGDGTNVLLNKKDKKHTLFNFLEDRANSYVEWKNKQAPVSERYRAGREREDTSSITPEQKSNTSKPRLHSKQTEQN